MLCIIKRLLPYTNNSIFLGSKLIKLLSSALSVQSLGVGPRAVKPNQIWQMDVTHILEFGKHRWIHVNVDTCTRCIFETPQMGESVKHVINHCLAAFVVLGPPLELKTDNGSAYTSSAFQHFCQQYQICHKTGIPYNTQGQTIM